MDYVHADEQRYAEAALLHRRLLQGENLFGTLDVERTADFAFGSRGSYAALHRLAGDDIVAAGQVELADFLFKSHLREQAVDKFIHTCLARGRSSQRHEGAAEQ